MLEIGSSLWATLRMALDIGECAQSSGFQARGSAAALPVRRRRWCADGALEQPAPFPSYSTTSVFVAIEKAEPERSRC
jgi:hypothetical protein